MIVGEQIEGESSCTEDLFLLSFYLVIQARTAQDPAYRSGFTFIKFFSYHSSYTCLFVCHFLISISPWPIEIPCLSPVYNPIHQEPDWLFHTLTQILVLRAAKPGTARENPFLSSALFHPRKGSSCKRSTYLIYLQKLNLSLSDIMGK